MTSPIDTDSMVPPEAEPLGDSFPWIPDHNRETLHAEEMGRVLVSDGLWRDVCERLWPYVRYFGLFGGELAAVQAVADLAVLLGRSTAHDVANDAAGRGGAVVDVADIADRSRAAAIEEVADWLESSRWIKRVSPDARDKFVRELRELASEPVVIGITDGVGCGTSE